MAELLIKNQKIPLSRAAERGDEIVVKLLLENGSRPDFEDEGWQTPLSRVSLLYGFYWLKKRKWITSTIM